MKKGIKMMRTGFSILACVLTLCLAACAVPSVEPVETAMQEQEISPEEAANQTEPVQPVRSDKPDDEYERAIWYGFVPEELASADPDSTVISWKQYCVMLGATVSEYDLSLLKEWKQLTFHAPETEMKRDGAMVSLLFAAKTMGLASFNAEPPTEFQSYADEVWNCVTLDYPVFDWDTPVDLGGGCSDNNHVGPAYDFCLRRVSAQSGKPLLEFDANDDLRLEQPLTLREAALSVIRLYESESIQRLEPDYVPVAEVGVFNLPDDLKEMAIAMPAVDAAALPAWNGIHLKIEDLEACEMRSFYQEEDIDLIANLGCFNYIGLGYEHWWYTKEENGELYVDEAVMKNIDDFICWCIERRIHVGFNTCSIPGFLVQAAGGYTDDILENPDHYRQAVELCAMLARRYAEVPANAMSYFLIGEPSRGYFTQESYLKLIQDLTSAMREYDDEKVICTSGLTEIQDHFVTTPVDGIGATGTVQAFNAYLRSQLYWNWPGVFVQGRIATWDDAPLTLNGDFAAGTDVTVYVYNVEGDSSETELAIAADDNELSRTLCEAGVHTELAVTVTLPEDANTITLFTENAQGGDMALTIPCISLKTPSASENTYAVPNLEGQIFWHYERGPYDVTNIWCSEWMWADFAPSTVTVHSDCTYDNPAQPFGFTPETLEQYASLWSKHTAREGTAAWCCEWGVPFSLPKEVRTGFVRAFLTTLKAHGISATMYWGRLGDWGPIIHESAFASGHLALPENWEAEGYSYKDGYYYDEATLDVMRELYGN